MIISKLVDRVAKFLKDRFDARTREFKDNSYAFLQKEALQEILVLLKGCQLVKAASKIAILLGGLRSHYYDFIREFLGTIYQTCCELIGEDFQLELFPDIDWGKFQKENQLL